MSISMKNLSDRITALENKINSGALGGWEKGENSNGYWLKEKSTGIILQFFKSNYNIPTTSVVTMPIAFSSTNYYVSGAKTQMSYEGAITVMNKQVNSFTVGFYGQNNWRLNGTADFIAIGYLISYRILNYIYKGIMHFLCGNELKIFGLNKGGV